MTNIQDDNTRDWESCLKTVPDELHHAVNMRLKSFLQACNTQSVGLADVESGELVKVFACSEFIARALINEPKLLHELVAENALDSPVSNKEIQKQLDQHTSADQDEQTFCKVVRRFRQKAWIRIAWRDICGKASVDQTLMELSAYAEIIIDQVSGYLDQQLNQEFGTPVTMSGRKQSLVVLALGKLGGRELNFSSDVDLIFCYQENGYFDVEKSHDYDAYFRRFGQRLIQILSERKEDGFLFRVDMRLRPYGDSGPLVMSFDAMEDYYQHQGRNWERYAMIKARVIAGDREAGQIFLAMIQPFVFRRYLDYDAFDSIREMKAMIMREVQRKSIETNIKIGAGGIREVEFIGQAFQLVRGGRNTALQSTGIIDILEKLAQLGYLSAQVIAQLLADYRHLRRCENLLQAVDEQQVHALPESRQMQLRLVLAMSYADWPELQAAVNASRSRIHQQFEQVFRLEEVRETEQPGDVPDNLIMLWNGKLSETEAVSELAKAGFTDPSAGLSLLTHFQQSRVYRTASERTHQRLEKLLTLVISKLHGLENPDSCFQRVLTLIEAITGRSAYLALLTENKKIIPSLLRLMAISPWIGAYLARHPILLDELLDARALYAPADKKTLEEDLSRRLSGLDMDDLEEQMEILRQFKHAQVLRVAAADIAEALPLMIVSDYLTQIAEVILDVVFNIAWYQMTSKYGRPCQSDSCLPESGQSGFVMIAYGKLGGIELGYGSDLDLIFLHDSHSSSGTTSGPMNIENKVFYVRLAQRIIHMLTTRTGTGNLYEIDIRLRPNGSSGLLVSDMESFAQYQRQQAWTWEHQALVRARPVAGDQVLGQVFMGVRHEILTGSRNLDDLLNDVREMRERMIKHLGKHDPDRFALKKDRGGIADIEFIVQFFLLWRARDFPDLIQYTDNIRQIEALQRNKLISEKEAQLLANAYREYRSRVHRLVLQEKSVDVDAAEYPAYRDAISLLWEKWIINGKFD